MLVVPYEEVELVFDLMQGSIDIRTHPLAHVLRGKEYINLPNVEYT